MFDQKIFIKKLKAIFYQLFNRKLPFVVFEKDDELEITDPLFLPEWIFTNVDYETMLAYDSKPDYFYSKVVLLNKEFINEFYQLFPLFKTTSCIVRVVDFLSSLSKADDITQCSLNNVMDDIVLSYPEKGITVDKVIGTHILDIDVEMYYHIWQSGLITSEWADRKFLTKDDMSNEKFIIEVNDSEPGVGFRTPRQAKVLVQVGLTVPSLPVLLKNTKVDDPSSQQCVLESGYDGDSVLINAKYSFDNLLSCISTQPAQRWFVRQQHKEPDHGREPETPKTQEQSQVSGHSDGLGKQDQRSEGEAGAESDAGTTCTGNCKDCKSVFNELRKLFQYKPVLTGPDTDGNDCERISENGAGTANS